MQPSTDHTDEFFWEQVRQLQPQGHSPEAAAKIVAETMRACSEALQKLLERCMDGEELAPTLGEKVMSEPNEEHTGRIQRSLKQSYDQMSEDENLNEMMVVAKRLNHVRFGWLQTTLFYRYVPNQITADEPEILAKMPADVRRRYLEAKAKAFRWMKPNQGSDAGPGESKTESQP
jgi:hypothetical protein